MANVSATEVRIEAPPGVLKGSEVGLVLREDGNLVCSEADCSGMNGGASPVAIRDQKVVSEGQEQQKKRA